MPRSSIKIAAIGDIMLDRAVGGHFFEKPEFFKLERISEILAGYDLVIANLENPVGLNGTPHPKQDPHVAFCCHPRTLEILKNLGVNVVSLANNHLLDYGEDTLKDTLEHLDDVNINHLGAGVDYEDANKPVLLNIKGNRVAILSSVMIYSASTKAATKNSPGVADYKINRLINKIAKLKRAGNIVIVSIHWGLEYSFYPIPYQRNQAKRIINAGASLIAGHGPHYPQGIERLNDGEIVFSLGNFIFDEPLHFANRSFIYGCDISPQGVLTKSTIYPFRILNHIPVLDDEGENSKTGRLVRNLQKIYERKSSRFWNGISNRWFNDVIWRITTMHSLKFIYLNPVNFYWTIVRTSFIRKLTWKNVKLFSTFLFRRSSHKSNNVKTKG